MGQPYWVSAGEGLALNIGLQSTAFHKLMFGGSSEKVNVSEINLKEELD